MSMSVLILSPGYYQLPWIEKVARRQESYRREIREDLEF